MGAHRWEGGGDRIQRTTSMAKRNEDRFSTRLFQRAVVSLRSLSDANSLLIIQRNIYLGMFKSL